ncbi:MAG TPA: metallophosphoesterase, partial [Steroidobacteraceae bacterium]
MKIVLLSDTHVAARAHAFNANLRAVLDWVRTLQPDLIVHLGDITADGVAEDGELEFAARQFDSVEAPLYFLPGNHDIGENPAAPGRHADPPLSLARLSEYRNVLGSDWWTIRRAGWQLIGLNASLFATADPEEERQFAWLEAQLAQGDGALGVLLHKPLFRAGRADREIHDRYVPWETRERLLRMLETRNLRFVFSGHTHQARRLQVGAVEHIWVPSTSFYIPDALQEPIGTKIVGVGILELGGRETGHGTYQFEFVSPAGVIRHNLFDHPEVYPVIKELR